MKTKRRQHWFSCQKCGQRRAVRTDKYNIYGCNPPRTPCPVCRDPAIDYHYIGYTNAPDVPFKRAMKT